jgi:hypothetical protein
MAEPEETFIARQRFGKQVPAEMNTHTTIEELPFLCNGEGNTPNNRGIVRKWCFLLDPTQGFKAG